ncbi:MAG: FAD-binding protein [Thermodesulfobacteriota bacterium]
MNTNSSSPLFWVFADTRDDRLFSHSLAVLSGASGLAGQKNGRTAAVLFFGADGMNGCAKPESILRNVFSHGADQAVVFRGAFADVPRPDVYARLFAAEAALQKPDFALFPLSEFSREVAARSAARLSCGMIADCMALAWEDAGLTATCPSWGGRIMARITFSSGAKTGFASVARNAFTRQEREKDSGEVIYAKTVLPAGFPLPELLERSPERDEGADLASARVVVAGGAGLGNAQNFGALRELAATLSGQVGATRPPVLNHWADEERLIGQTGKSVRPDLLICVGASGAVQFTAGIAEAKTVVAVNRDKNAPIFSVADIGIVADAAEFVRHATAKAKVALLRSLADRTCSEDGPATKESFGAAIRRLRENRQWSVEKLAEQTGMSPEFIAEVESDAAQPSVAFLLRLARALDVDPALFLSEQEKNEIKGKRADAYSRRTDNYSYRTLTPGAESEHLRAFLITIEPRQAHKPVAYKHEGEEFVYVFAGELQLTLGGREHVLKPGESQKFNSEIPHKLKSLSDTDTQCLVVLYTP